MAKKTDSAKKPAIKAAPAKTVTKPAAKQPAPAPKPTTPAPAPVSPAKAKPVKKPAPTASVAPAKTKKIAAPKVKSAPAKVITTEEIALEAYFISERRQAAGLAGDSHTDWLEAERVLQERAGSRTPKSRAKKSA